MNLNKDLLLVATCLLVAILSFALLFLGTAQNETIKSYQSALDSCISRSNLQTQEFNNPMNETNIQVSQVWRSTK